MAARSETMSMPTMSMPKKAPTEETLPEPIGQRRPTQERFRLQVDRQTKATYTTIEAAERAGRAIKNAHPIVKVAVYDAVESANTVIEAS